MAQPNDSALEGVSPEDQGVLARFFDQASEVMTVVDCEGRFLYVNKACERVLGVPRDELIGLSAFDFIHEADRDETVSEFDKWMIEPAREAVSFENRQISRGGEVRRMLWTVRVVMKDGDVRGFTSSGRDVTSERAAANALVKSETRVRALMEGMLDPMISIDPRGIMLEASDSVRGLFGYEPSELIGENISILLPEPYRSEHDGYLEKYARTGATWILNTTRTFEVSHRNGEMRWVDISVSRVEVPEESEPVFAGSFRDVTARVEAEEARREIERRLRAVFDQTFEFVGLLDVDGAVLDVNRAALEASGESYEDVIGRPFWETRWWASDPAERERVKRAVKRVAKGEFVRFEAEFSGGTDNARTVDFSLKPIRDTAGEIVMLIPEGRDITELKQAQMRETAMLKALATIGESAAVLAHEIKNPITAVNLALRAVADQLGEGQAEILEDLASRMQRLEKLMRRTLAFTKPLEMQLEHTSPKSLLDDACQTLRPEFESKQVEVKATATETCPDVNVDSNLIEEVLTNLLHNAIDALEQGGRVRLSATAAPGGGVRLRVEDSGPGLTDSFEDSLFRPFFTTKAEGTGLGLAICRKIVEEHGGTITTAKGELSGACFEIWLPVAVKAGA